jgi:NAD(P)H dehydrogenase (quinone)
MSLHTLDAYLEHGFAMKSSEHLHFGGVVEGTSQRFIDQNLYDVTRKARSVCAAVAADQQQERVVAA